MLFCVREHKNTPTHNLPLPKIFHPDDPTIKKAAWLGLRTSAIKNIARQVLISLLYWHKSANTDAVQRRDNRLQGSLNSLPLFYVSYSSPPARA
jgi:hypothetical protein